MTQREPPPAGGGCPVHPPYAAKEAPVSLLQADDSARFEALLDAAVDGVIVIGGRGLIERFNPAAERMFGYPAAEVVGRNVSVLMPEPDRSAHDAYIARYLETIEPRVIGIGREVIGRRKDGSTFPCHLSVGHIRLGEIDQFVGIAHDISERRRIENEARDLLERLAHAGRLGDLGEMATTVAHELDQPLTAIANYAQVCRFALERETAEPAEILATLDKITRGARHAGEVIRRYRALAKKRDSERRTHDLNELARDVIRLAEIEARLRDARIELTLEPGPLPVRVDGVQIQQVLLNLARNGMEAMLDLPAAERLLSVETSAADGEAVIAVRDRGAGLSREAAEQAFEPFFTTKREGMGMGLSLCRTIVEAHGGRLEFTTGAERGTTFRFSLPVAAVQKGEKPGEP